MSNDANKGYQFTVLNGAVTAVYEIKNGRAEFEKMDRDETWSVDGSNIVKTETEHGRIETTIYTDINGDGIFAKMPSPYGTDGTLLSNQNWQPSTLTSTLQNGYQFDIVDGSVITVYEIERGYKSQERIDFNENWTIDGANIIKTEVEHGVTETSIYTDLAGNGVFSKVSTSYVATDGSVWSGRASGTDNDDQWRGNNSDDQYYAGNGNDRLTGGYGNDDLYGADGDDQMNGDTGSDDLFGGIGNDILVGGAGSDDLYGGLGNDSFKYANVFESGLTISTRDSIHDFTSGDKLDLSGIDAKSGNWINDAFTYVGAATNVSTANANGAVWFENEILYGSNDRDTAAEFQIQLVSVTVLAATDLIL